MKKIYIVLFLLGIFCIESIASNVFVKYDSHFGAADSLYKIQRFIQEEDNEDKKLVYLPIQITKDGIPVVFSGQDLSEVSGMQGRIKDYSFNELHNVNLNNKYNYGADYLVLENANNRIHSIDDFIKFDISNCNVVIELLDSPFNGFATLRLLGEKFNPDIMNYSYFLIKNPEQRDVLSYYNYMYNDSVPVLCDVNFSSVIREYRNGNESFTSPMKKCTKSGIIIDFDYDNIDQSSDLLVILGEYISFLNNKKFIDKIFIDLHKNVSNEVLQVFKQLGIHGVFIDTDFGDISDEIFDLDGFKNSPSWEKYAISNSDKLEV